MKIAATMSVLAAQRFGEEFGRSDGVGTCPIPTLASKFLIVRILRRIKQSRFPLNCGKALGENRPSPPPTNCSGCRFPVLFGRALGFLAGRCDAISIHLPLVDSSYLILDDEFFAAMQPSA